MKPEIWLTEFVQALAQLNNALAVKADHDVNRVGCIQYFEFTSELALKTIKAVAQDNGLGPSGSPKSCLKVAFAQNWIQDETIWLEMLNARNRMSHTYDAQDALQICDQLPCYVQPLADLLTRLQAA